jgi:group I intron endonuclease
VYVGSAVQLLRRWAVHRHLLREGKHHCPALQRAYKKHGGDVAFEVLERCERERLVEREQWWFGQFPKLYNVLTVAGSRLGAKMSAGQARRHSEFMKRRLVEKPDCLEALMEGKRRFLEANPGFLERTQREHWSRLGAKEEQAERARKQFQRGGAREAQAARTRKYLEDNPEHKALKIAQLRSPEARAKAVAAKRGKPNPGHGARMKKHYEANPEAREQAAAKVRALWVDPEYRAAMIEKRKQKWADPEFRARWLAARWKKGKV